MVLILDEIQDGVTLLVHTTGPKKDVKEWSVNAIDKIAEIPKGAEFNILLYVYDELSGVKLGCNRYTNCELNRLNLFEKTFNVSCKFDKFYNNSEQKDIRADKIEGSLNL